LYTYTSPQPLLLLLLFAGSIAYGAVGVYTLAIALRYNAPPLLLARMGANVAFNTALRSIPIIGSFTSPAAESTSKNIQLLQQYLHKKAPKAAGVGLGIGKKSSSDKSRAVGKSGGEGWRLPKLKFRSMALLVVGVLLIPLSIGLGVSVFALYVALKWLGWWPFILRP
jgi:hypothetical protein